jgi:dihydrofolate synthase/folylpolyglutamate synthase
MRARLECVSRRPLVLVDGAHNPASLALLAETVRAVAPEARRVFVVGMAADKDVFGSMRRLSGAASHVVATTSGQPRAATPSTVAGLARRAGLSASEASDVAKALREARRRAGRDGVIVVTGSLYLCGEALRILG